MMSRGITNTFCIFEKYMQNNMPMLLGPTSCGNNTLQPVRYHKHWNPKFKKERKLKVVSLQQIKKQFEITPANKEFFRGAYGFPLHNTLAEKPIFLSSTTDIMDPYIPPEGDGKYSITTKEGMKQKLFRAKMKAASMNAIRKIKSADIDFERSTFLKEALEIYIKAHEKLAEKDYEELIKYVTENAFPKMAHGTKLTTIKWKLVKLLDPVRIVHARQTNVDTLNKQFGQITVRFHTQQILSIYDRFGRLMQGSDIITKDVLEYIVFEKPFWFKYGTWRIHDKIIPSWVPKDESPGKTYVLNE